MDIGHCTIFCHCFFSFSSISSLLCFGVIDSGCLLILLSFLDVLNLNALSSTMISRFKPFLADIFHCTYYLTRNICAVYHKK